jgi:23S rRNA (cytosine1962-C5)-methyltransferase
MKTTKKQNPGRFIFPSDGLDYELIDSGNRRKLERFGSVLLNRPESLAIWKPNLSKSNWEKAHWYFFEEKGKKGEWKQNHPAAKEWNVKYANDKLSLNFELELTAFKHVGLFPEQAANWHYIEKQVNRIQAEEVKVLNLFAYTGAASIVAAQSGAKVTNVDSVKQVLNWGRKNAEANQEDNIRWILEDARKFVEKAIRREDKYHGIIMDPPVFGMGAKKEVWKLEQDLKPLLESVMQIIDKKQNFFILNTYSPKLPMPALKNLLKETRRFPKQFESGTLGLMSTSKQQLGLGNLVRFYT